MRTIDIGRGVIIGDGDLVLMGVVNCSPESPNRDVFASTPAEARAIAGRHADTGCGIIDIGARSTRSKVELTCEEEIKRLGPVVEAVVALGIPVSLDTWSPGVVNHATDLGVSLVNDTSGSRSEEMTEALLSTRLPTVVMFSRGPDPRGSASTAAPRPVEIVDQLDETSTRLRDLGCYDLILDPGIGIAFGDYEVEKVRRQSQIIDVIPDLRSLGHPVLIPVPRKERFHLTVALASQAIDRGADVLRIHDSEMARDVADMYGR